MSPWRRWRGDWTLESMRPQTSSRTEAPVFRLFDDPLEGFPDIPLALAEEVQGEGVAIDGVATDAILPGNPRGVAPTNPFLLDFLSSGMSTNGAMEFVPTQTDDLAIID